MGLIFGQLLRHTREERGLTLREFAKSLGVSPSYISDVELGHRKTPSMEKLKRIADILNCDLEEMIWTRTIDDGKVTLAFKPEPSIKAELALLLEAQWDNMDSEKISLLTDMLAGETESEA
jgi:transcriptional regulator with XRE-family HTH domain